MLKHTIATTLLTLSLIAPAFAQATANTALPPSATAQPASYDAAIQNCEAQMHRMAGLNKALGANYNAERVHRDCAAGVYGK